MTDKLHIIALTGQAGSGKDTAHHPPGTDRVP